jgi:hypothetical protein
MGALALGSLPKKALLKNGHPEQAALVAAQSKDL